MNLRPSLNLALVLLVGVAAVYAAEKPPITAEPLTIATIRRYVVGVAKSSDVATSDATIDAWMVQASTTLQSISATSSTFYADVACPMELTRGGVSVTTFSASLGIVNNSATYHTLLYLYPDQKVKIVSQILVCKNTPVKLGVVAVGCAPPNEQILLRAASADGEALAHEWGHLSGVVHTSSETAYRGRLMYPGRISGIHMAIVTEDECRKIMRGPRP